MVRAVSRFLRLATGVALVDICVVISGFFWLKNRVPYPHKIPIKRITFAPCKI